MTTVAKNGRLNGAVLDKKLPSDVSAEMAVLGAVLINPQVLDQHDIRAEHFNEDRHRRILAHLARLRENLVPIDSTHLAVSLRDSGELERIGGAGYIADVMAECVTLTRFPEYLAQLHELAARRQAYFAAVDVLRDVHDPSVATVDILSAVRDRLDRVEARGAGGFNIRTLSSREFDSAEYVINMLIESVMAEGQSLVIAAPLKTLKTTIAIALAIALALGRPFLGKFWTQAAVRVLVLSGESGRTALQSAGRRIAETYGVSLGNVEGLFWGTDLPKLDNDEHLAVLLKLLQRDKINVLILDPLYFCLPGADAGNLMIVGAHLQRLSGICDECGVTLVVVHHVRKSGIENRNAPPELSQISWSGTAEWARQWLLLSRRKDYVAGSGLHRLWMVTGGSAGHSGLHALDVFEGVGDSRTWQVDVLSGDEVREAEEDAKDKAKRAADEGKIEAAKRSLCDAMVKFPTGETERAIRDAAGVSGSLARDAFAALLQDGSILPCDVMKPNRRTPYEGYRLNMEEAT